MDRHSRDDPAPVTLLLRRWSGGDRTVEDELFDAIYGELRLVARRLMRNERPDHTLEPTALVNEAYVRLVQGDTDFDDRQHFLAVAARVMRRFLIDYARGRGRLKRAGGRRVTLDPRLIEASAMPIDVVAFDDALRKLEAEDDRKAEFVLLRHLAGMSNEQIAERAGVSARTVKRDLKYARAFLRAEIEEATPW
jgi:RNA polymerase sigma factor (TIGR02999 family)